MLISSNSNKCRLKSINLIKVKKVLLLKTDKNIPYQQLVWSKLDLKMISQSKLWVVSSDRT